MEWLKRLSEAIDYIEDNLENDISYDEAAKIACCSTYYFQRMFSYVADVSLSEYIRRRRMTKAAFELQRSNAKAMDVGTKYGYDSPTSFNRAFQKIHGVAPTTARKKGTILQSFPPIRFTIHVSGGDSMKYRVQAKGPIRILGVRTPIKEDAEENFKIVPSFWNKTIESNQFSKICHLSNQMPNGILGVSVYEDPEHIFYYIAAATDQDLPKNLIEYNIPAATWVIFECKGPFQETVQNIFKRFLTEWLPFSGYKYAGLPDIEIYPISDQKLEGGHSEIWIAIKETNKHKKEDE